MSFVFNAIGDVAEFVIGAVEDVIDFAVDNIIEPVWRATGDVIQAVIDDPIATIATIAATLTPGMQWAVPLIQAADTVAKGGNIWEAIEAAALGYVGGEFAGKVSSAVTNATGSAVAGSLTGKTVSGMVQGKSFEDAIKSAAISGVFTEVASMATDVVTTNLPSVDLGDFTFDKNTENALKTGIEAYLTSGGSITQAALTATTATIAGFLKESSVFDGDITDGLISAVKAGLRGGDILGAFNSTLYNAGVSDLTGRQRV